jgi:hypothetical protein
MKVIKQLDQLQVSDLEKNLFLQKTFYGII